MSFLKRLVFPAYLIAVTVLICIVLEWGSLQINKQAGKAEPFFWGDPIKFSALYKRGFRMVDPHLGYAHGASEANVKALAKRFIWRDGFAIYAPPGTKTFARPIILTLGGSTTDPVHYGHSWPEELAALMKARGIAGTVINGGAGAYTSSQELLKLIRDGIEFAPDIVISYSGVNDRHGYGKLPHPMVHAQQRKFFDTVLHPKRAPVLPNAVALIKRSFARSSGAVTDYSLGLATKRTLPQWYVRNLRLMRAVSEVSGARFYGVLQPNAYVGPHQGDVSAKLADPKSKRYVRVLRDFYRDLMADPALMRDLHDFTGIMGDAADVYIDDGIHTTPKGEKIIAAKMLELIGPALAQGGR